MFSDNRISITIDKKKKKKTTTTTIIFYNLVEKRRSEESDMRKLQQIISFALIPYQVEARKWKKRRINPFSLNKKTQRQKLYKEFSNSSNKVIKTVTTNKYIHDLIYLIVFLNYKK